MTEKSMANMGMPNSRQTMRLEFAQPIKQVGPSTIEVEMEDAPRHFTNELITHVHHIMGVNRGEMLLDEMANSLNRKLILDAVK